MYIWLDGLIKPTKVVPSPSFSIPHQKPCLDDKHIVLIPISGRFLLFLKGFWFNKKKLGYILIVVLEYDVK